MKNSSQANFTLSPVRRATAFFALLGFLTLSSCGEKQESMSDVMGEQTEVFQSMTVVLNEVENGADPIEAADKLTALAEKLKELKVRLSKLSYADDSVSDGDIADREDFASAAAAFQMAQQKLFMSGKLTPEINRAITAHHNPAPMVGEGSSQ